MNLRDMMGAQQQAVTRRKVSQPSMADVIYAEMPYYRQAVDQRRAYERSLAELAQQNDQARRAEALQQEQMDASRQQGLLSSGISGLGTAASLGKTAFDLGLFGSGAAGAAGAPASVFGAGHFAGLGGIFDAAPAISGGASAAPTAIAGGTVGAGATGWGALTSASTLSGAGPTALLPALGVVGAALGIGFLGAKLLGFMDDNPTPGIYEHLAAAKQGAWWKDGKWVQADTDSDEWRIHMALMLQSHGNMGYVNEQGSYKKEAPWGGDLWQKKNDWAAGSWGFDPKTYKYTGVIPDDLGEDPFKPLDVTF